MVRQAKKQAVDPREFWVRHLADCSRSGLSYAEYCRRHDLTVSAFGYWRKKLSASPHGKPAFVELKVAAFDPGGIEIILRNQIRVALDSDFDETLLVRLIGVLEAI